VYLKTWYDPLLDAPPEPRIIVDRPPPAAARPLTGLRRHIATALFKLGHRIAPEPHPVRLVRATQRPAQHRF
jgi:hypothetical protein